MKRELAIIIIAIAVKIIYVLFALGYSNYSTHQLDINNSQDVVNLFKKNQAYWYERVAVESFEKTTPDQLGNCEEDNMIQSKFAFFPLYPFTVRFTMYAVNTGFNSMALVYSLVFSILLFIIFYRFVKLYFNSENIAFWSALLLIVFPFHYYFSVFYPEALYLLLLMGSFLAIHKKRWFLLSLLVGLMVLSRPNGIIVLIPLFIYFLEQQYTLDFKSWKKRKAKEFLPVLAFLSAPLFLLLYGFYLQSMTGDFFALKTAQLGWCRWTTAPWKPILNSHTWQEFFELGYFVVFIGIALLFMRKLPLGLNLLIWFSLLIPLFYNTMTVPRYISLIFVFFMFLGSYMSRLKDRWNVVILIALFLVQLWSFSYWLISDELSF